MYGFFVKGIFWKVYENYAIYRKERTLLNSGLQKALYFHPKWRCPAQLRSTARRAQLVHVLTLRRRTKRLQFARKLLPVEAALRTANAPQITEPARLRTERRAPRREECNVPTSAKRPVDSRAENVSGKTQTLTTRFARKNRLRDQIQIQLRLLTQLLIVQLKMIKIHVLEPLVASGTRLRTQIQPVSAPLVTAATMPPPAPPARTLSTKQKQESPPVPPVERESTQLRLLEVQMVSPTSLGQIRNV